MRIFAYKLFCHTCVLQVHWHTELDRLHPPELSTTATAGMNIDGKSAADINNSNGSTSNGGSSSSDGILSFDWMAVIWTRALNHQLPQVQRLAVSSLLDRRWPTVYLRTLSADFLAGSVILAAARASLSPSAESNASPSLSGATSVALASLLREWGRACRACPSVEQSVYADQQQHLLLCLLRVLGVEQQAVVVQMVGMALGVVAEEVGKQALFPENANHEATPAAEDARVAASTVAAPAQSVGGMATGRCNVLACLRLAAEKQRGQPAASAAAIHLFAGEHGASRVSAAAWIYMHGMCMGPSGHLQLHGYICMGICMPVNVCVYAL